MGEVPRGGGMGRSGVVRDGFSCWLLCLTDFHLPHPAALLYSALHLQRRITVTYFILTKLGSNGHKQRYHSKHKGPVHLLQLVLNTQTSKELLPSLIPEMPKPRGAAGSKSYMVNSQEQKITDTQWKSMFSPSISSCKQPWYHIIKMIFKLSCTLCQNTLFSITSLHHESGVFYNFLQNLNYPQTSYQKCFKKENRAVKCSKGLQF